MSAKSSDKRKNQAAKLVQKPEKKPAPGKASLESGLKDQYFIIREDLMKLRDDLAKGYDMAKEWVDKRNVRGLLRAK